LPARFRIERPRGFFPDSKYRVHVQGAVIVASAVRKFRDKRALAWTWIDGTEYAWLRPDGRKGAWLHLVSDGRTLCSGEILVARKHKNRGKRVITCSQWEIGGQTLVLQGSHICCGSFPTMLTLREADEKRLACWVSGRVEGILRQGMHQELVPVILGIVLTTVHNFWGTSGDGD